MTDNLIVSLTKKHYDRIAGGGVHAAVFHEEPPKRPRKIMVLIALDTTVITREDYVDIIEGGVDILPRLLTREQLRQIRGHEGAAMSKIVQPLDVQVLVIDEADLKQFQFCDGCPTPGKECPMPRKQDYRHCSWKDTYVETKIWGKKL